MSREKDVEEAKIALLSTFCSRSTPIWLPDTQKGIPYLHLIKGYKWDVLNGALEELWKDNVLVYIKGAWKINVRLDDRTVVCPICQAEMYGHVVKHYHDVPLYVDDDNEISWDNDDGRYVGGGELDTLRCLYCGVEFYEGSVNYVKE